MAQLTGPEAWQPADLTDQRGWRFELDQATAEAPSPTEVDRTHFDPPEAANLCRLIHDTLETGVGFAVLSGLPFDALEYGEQVALTLGLSDQVGRVVPQNYELQRIVDVRDEGIAYSHRSRGYRSNKHLPFHTDGAHLFSLTCLGVAAEGGETIIASGSAVYNRMAAEYPEALEILCRGFYHHRRGQHDPGEAPLSAKRVPVFAFHGGLLNCCYNRNPIEWAEKEGVTLSADETAALDALDDVLARDETQMKLNLQPGESAFINNFITMHSRTEYADGDGHRRHMLRVWMSDPESRRSGFSLLELYVPERHVNVA